MTADRTERILDQAHNAVISVDTLGAVTYWNPSAERIFDRSREDALGRSVAELIIPDRYREAHTAGIKRFLTAGVGPLLGRRIEMSALRADGSEFPVEMTISALEDDGGWAFTAFIQDLSGREEDLERDRVVEELRRALLGTERRFDAVVGSLSDPVTIRDREHRIIYANKAALTHLGYASWDDLRGVPPGDIMADYVVLGEHGEPVSMDQIPSVRILRGEATEPLLIQTVNRHTGVHRWNLLKAAPLFDEAGEVEATIMMIEDVTEQRAAVRGAAFLAEASRVLASSLDYERTLRNVAELAVPSIVDWCAVDLIDEDGDRIPVSVAHVDPARLRLAEELRQYEPSRPDPEQGMGRVLRTGEPLLIPDISDEMLVAAATDDRHLTLLRAVGFRSALIVPITLGLRTLGTMTLVSAESGRVLGKADMELTQLVAARAAVAIENARLYGERSKIAATLQRSLLPDLPEIPGYELASVYMPAYQGTEVGGDFYDAWEVDGGWMLAIGDVTGKGVEAAALTSLVRHTLRAVSEFRSSPAELLSQLDHLLKKERVRSICTALCARVSGDRVTLAVGGHPLPFLINARGVNRVGEHGSLLGAFEDVEWHETDLTLEPRDTLITYTDGVTDAIRDDGERFGTIRLRSVLHRHRELAAAELVARVADSLHHFQVGAHADDVAIVALKRRDLSVD